MTVDVTRRALRLFREILTLHRTKLPPVMRSLGDTYVKNEFKTHMYSGTCSKAQFEQFLTAWETYAGTIRDQQVVTGKSLTPEQKRLMNEKQKEQLDELEKATAELADDVKK